MARGEIAVGQALLEDGFGHLTVQGQAIGLPVLLIPAEIEPSQALEDGGEGASVLRSTSVSSMRRIMTPPLWRA